MHSGLSLARALEPDSGFHESSSAHKNQCVGFISSGGTGFRIGRSRALAYIQNDVNPQATQFSVNILGQLCPATLSQRAFYDPDNERLRS